MRNIMSWIKNAPLVLVSTAISLIALEFGLRVTYPEKTNLLDVRDHSDPYFPRHAAGIHIDKRRNTIATFDEVGLRLNPNKCAASSDSMQILLVGDSNIAGLFLDDSETLGARLTQISSEYGRCMDIDTFGVSGFGSDQTYFAIDALTKSHNYDYVIFHIFADNDIGDLIRNSYFKDDAMINDGYCYMQKPLLDNFVMYKVFRKVWYLLSGQAAGYGIPTASTNDIRCSYTPKVYKDTFAESTMTEAILDWDLHLDGQRQVYMDDRYDIEFACDSNPAAIDYASDAFSFVVKKAEEISNDRGFQIIFLVQPSEDDVTRNHIDKLDKGCSTYNPRAISNFFVNILKDKNVVDLFQEFNGCSECFFGVEELGIDNHWSPFGVNLAAMQLQQFISDLE